MDDDKLFDLIEQAYDCAVDGQWYALLENVSSAFSDSKAFVGASRKSSSGQQLLCGTHDLDSLLPGYMKEIHLDPCAAHALKVPHKPLLLNNELKAEVEQSPVHKWYRQMEVDFAMGRVLPQPKTSAVFGVNRSARQCQFTQAEYEAFDLLSGHMGMVLKSAHTLGDLVRERVSQWQAEHVKGNPAIAIVRKNGSPVYISAKMERLVDGTGPFKWQQGAMTLENALEAKRLQQAHDNAISGAVRTRLGSSIPVADQRLQVIPLSAAVYENASLWLIS
ncbi:hypothetical protein [Ferrimonas aestuarii]|uniref:GAF domain-containing protein n=1 Tax=Ferrimonas aestuarii TaxID=2569539 RepID=A0A4U1BMM1_9GAMM|nr:hypothetical protein [Ferrimonas aestuarii]TKB53978.1 hypothetical protein FCL42_13565 [Ferrimonas aestuarii]